MLIWLSVPTNHLKNFLLTMASYGGSAGHAEVMRACHARGLRSDPADVIGTAALAAAAVAAEDDPSLLSPYLDEGKLPVDYVNWMDTDLFMWQ
jgi:hypothetical protein